MFLDFLFKQNNKNNWWKKFPEANDTNIGNVVITQNLNDVAYVTWYDTGINMSVYQWEKLSRDCGDARMFYCYWEDRLKRL